MMIGKLQKPSVDFHLACQHSLHFCGLIVPGGNLGGTSCKLAFLRNHSQLFLSREGLLPEFVPTLIELAFIFVCPLLRNVVRCMGCSRCEVHEKRLGCDQQSLLTHPI